MNKINVLPMEDQALYELIFSEVNPSENELMALCRSRNPLNEISNYRRLVRRRYRMADSLDGILANAFRKSLALVSSSSADVLLQDFVGSAAFSMVSDIPGYKDERSLSECFYEYLRSIVPNSDSTFHEALMMDFFQSLLIEAAFSPACLWIKGHPALHISPKGEPRVKFRVNRDIFIIAIEGNRIVKYRVNQ
jgi:hypothetical protein